MREEGSQGDQTALVAAQEVRRSLFLLRSRHVAPRIWAARNNQRYAGAPHAEITRRKARWSEPRRRLLPLQQCARHAAVVGVLADDAVAE